MPYIGKKPADIIATVIDTTTGTFSGDLTVDTNTLYVDSANNRVGVGTSSPTHALTVQYNDQTTTAKFQNTNTSGTGIDSAKVTIESTSRDASLSITAQSSRSSFIDFGDEVSSTRGRILYAHSDDSMQILTANSERMRIDSSGNLGIGTSSPAAGLHIDNPNNSAITAILDTDNSAVKIVFRNNTETGNNVQIGADGSNLVALTNGSERMRIDSSGRVMIGTTTEGAANEAEELTIAGTGGVGMTIRSTDSGTSRIYFSDGTSGTPEYAGYQIYNHSSNAMIFGTNATEHMRIDSSGHLLVGTTTEGESSADDLTIATTGNTGITIRSGTSGSGNLYFSDGTSGADEYRGYLQYHHSSNLMVFGTDTQGRMYIDSSGHVLIGKTVSDNTTVGVNIEDNGFMSISRSNNISMILNRSNDGEILRLTRSGSTIGGIYSSPSVTGPFIGHINVGLVMYHAGNSVLPSGTGGLRDNAIDLGNSSNRFDDVFATNGTIQTSDQNEKNTITDSDLGIDFIKRLTPKSYIFNGKTRTHYGLIAQDVETVLTDINKPTSGFAGFIKSDISEEQDGSEYRYGLRYTEFVAPLIQAVKDQQVTIDAQQTTITALEARITALENA